MNIKQTISYQQIIIWLFFFMIVTDLIFGESEQYIFIPKLLMLLFFAFFILWTMKCKYSIKIPTVSLLFVVIEFLSCIWAVYPDVAFSQFVTQVQLFVLFVFVYNMFKMEDCLDIYYKAIFSSGILMAILAIYNYGLNGIVGMMLQGTRVGSMLGNQNTYGMVFSRAAIVAFSLFLFKKKRGYVLCIGLFSFLAFSSGSRKAILMILVGIIGVSIFTYGIKKMWKTVIISILVLLALYAALKLPYMRISSQRLFDMLEGTRDASALERDRFIRIGWEAIQKRPILGYGIANFGAVFPGSGYSHNNFIELLFSMGFVGFIIYYMPYARATKYLIYLTKETHDWRFAVIFTFLLINIIFAWGMVQFYSRESWVMLAVVLGSISRKSIM